MSTIRKHHVNVLATDELWRRLRAAAALEGLELGELLGDLVADHLGQLRQRTAVEPAPGQLTTEDAAAQPRRSSSRRSRTGKTVSQPPAARKKGAAKP